MALVLLVACGPAPAPVPAPLAALPTPEPGVLAPAPAPDTGEVPEVAAERARIARYLAAEPPIIPLEISEDDERGAEKRAAQEIALALPELIRAAGVITATQEGQRVALRTEVLEIAPLRASNLNPSLEPCAEHMPRCWQLTLYNYATHSTVGVFVDLTRNAVLAVSIQDGARATVPEHLALLAERIAAASPLVQEALASVGRTATTSDAPAGDSAATAPIMAGTQTLMRDTSCAYRRHLCVAPTYVVPEQQRALWAVVDLTRFELVGIQWTGLGELAEPPAGLVDEQSIHDSYIAAEYCTEADPAQATSFDEQGWSGRYALTDSDGLKLWDLAYQGRVVLRSAKLVDVHVAYDPARLLAQIRGGAAPSEGDAAPIDDPGYSDGVGCPTFSQSAVLASGPPARRPLIEQGEVRGLEIWQTFKSPLWPSYCNYYYVQIFRLYADGRFQVLAGNAGRGCGDFGTYRPVLRLALAPEALTLSEWQGGGWQSWEREGWRLQDAQTSYTDEGYQYRVMGEDGAGWYLEPGQGQFVHNRGDNAYVYLTRYRAEEGEQDLGAIGSCCRSDEQQGPEQYLNDEPVAGEELTLWYVGQMRNDATPGDEYCWADRRPTNLGLYEDVPFPCLIGPMFHPFDPGAGASP